MPIPEVPCVDKVDRFVGGSVRITTGAPREVESEVVIRELIGLDLVDWDDDEVLAFFVSHGSPVPDIRDKWHMIDGPEGQRVDLHHEVERLRELQTAARHLIAMRSGSPTVDIWYGNTACVVQSDDAESVAAGNFVRVVNQYLTPMHPRIVLTYDDGGPHGARDYGQPLVGLLEALAVQLFNLIVDDEVPLRVCPVCGTSFQRQRGRAKQDQHRTVGVTYCSMRCARNKANRDYRKRKRQETK